MTDSSSVAGFAKCDTDSSSIGGIKINPTNLVDSSDLDKMVEESLKDVSSEEDGDDLESDDELMRELKEMTEGPLIVTNNQQQEVGRILSTASLITVDVLKHRIEMYKLAAANAETAGQSAKVRRLRRGLTRLNGLLSQANAGEQIISDDIPLEVTTKPMKATPTVTAEEPSPESIPSTERA